MLKIDVTQATSFLNSGLMEQQQLAMQGHFNTLVNGSGAGSEYLGWVDLPISFSEEELEKISVSAAELRRLEVVVVIGIGGSYLGARAVIDALGNYFKPSTGPRIVFAGCNLSERYLSELLDFLDKKEFGIIAISKSGSTTEPAIAFRVLKNKLYQDHPQHASARIVCITDPDTGILRELSESKGYTTFAIQNSVGGRYSVLSPVGLLPIACGGYNISELLRGARDMRARCLDTDFNQNPAFAYATVRNALYLKGKKIEMTVCYEDKLRFILEWWKQLYGESEGKDGKGIMPSSAVFTSDLHSLGQIIQDGERNLFETTLWINENPNLLKINKEEQDFDKLNYLDGKWLSEVNEKAMLGTIKAHTDGLVPNILISIDTLDEYHLGELIYFYEFACGLSGYALGVNPFDQPGVEMYKQNMFQLLGRP